MFARMVGRLLAALGASLLVSCGGGSGGGDSGVSVSSDKSSLTFLGFSSSPPASQSIQFTLNSGKGTYYGAVTADQPGLFSASFSPTSDTSAVVTVTPVSPSVGTHSGALHFMLCSDSACNQVAWSQNIPYTMTVFGVDTTSLAVTGYEGSAAPARTISITPADSTAQITVSSEVQSGGSAWLSAQRVSASSIGVIASANGLAKGSYQGTVRLAFAGAPQAQLQIPVSFTVGDGIVAPPAVTLNLTANSASLAGTANVSFQGNQSPAWTASSDQAWLVVGTTGGTGPGSLPFSVDTSKLGAIANWSSAQAHVTLSAPGLSSVSFPVTLNKKLPEVWSVSPNPVRAGSAFTLHVFGRGFSQYADANSLQVSGAGGTTGSIVSDAEAVLSVPALAAGTSTVSALNAAGLQTRSSSTAVVASTALPYAAVPSSGEKRSALFDPSRNAVYAINLSQNTLLRYRLTGGSWQMDSLVVGSIGDMGFSPDRKTLYVGSGAQTLLAVDPDTLTVRSTYTLPTANAWDASISPGRYFTRGMAVTNNGRLWFGDSQWAAMNYFDMDSGTFRSMPSSAVPDGSLYSPEFYASADGSKMMVVQYGISPTPKNILYSSLTDSMARTTLPQTYQDALLSEDGSKVLLDSAKLYRTADNMLIGTVKVSGAGFGTAGVLSPDGTRAYRLVTSSQNSTVIDHIDVLDTTQVVNGSSDFVNLGQIAVTDQATNCGSNPPYGCSVVGTFIISPFGDTLFWIGNQRLVVIPIPSGLSGISGTGSKLLPAARR